MAITDIANEILAVRVLGIPVVFILAGLIVLFIVLYKRSKKPEDNFKAVNTTKEIKNDLDELFKLAHEKTGLWLKSGTVNLGYIIEAVRLNLPKANIEAKDIKAVDIKVNDPNSLEAVKKQIENKTTDNVKCYAFKLASCNVLKRQLQKLLNRAGVHIGLNYMIIEEALLTMSDFNIVVDPYCVPTYYFKTWIYSKAGFNFVENIAIKIKHQLLVDSLVNEVPKLTYLEIRQSKDMEQLNALAKIKSKRQKEMLEEISKGDI